MNPPATDLQPESWLVTAGRGCGSGAPLNVPLVPASNFILGGDRAYSRDDGTPTWEALEEIIGGLESGRAVAFASGMAAIAAVFDQLPAGSIVVLPDDCYQGVAGLAAAGAQRGRWSVQRLAGDDTAGWVRTCAQADLIWLESPSNPLLGVADLPAICAAPRRPGALVAVVGCGGVGLATINGALIAGASRIIAIDSVPGKLELARKFGATDVLLASDGDVAARVIEMTKGGVEFSFECIGIPATVEQCFRMLQPGGTATIVGLFAPGSKVSVEGSDFFLEKKLKGSALGSARIRDDIPRLVELYMQGRLNLDDLVSRRIKLGEINEGFAAMQRGEVARSVIVFEGADA